MKYTSNKLLLFCVKIYLIWIVKPFYIDTLWTQLVNVDIKAVIDISDLLIKIKGHVLLL